MEAPESHHQVHSEVPAMRRGVPKMSGQLIMTFPATCSFFFFFLAFISGNKNHLLLVYFLSFFSFNFCIGSCEIFIWKYINHISTVKEATNQTPLDSPPR